MPGRLTFRLEFVFNLPVGTSRLLFGDLPALSCELFGNPILYSLCDFLLLFPRHFLQLRGATFVGFLLLARDPFFAWKVFACAASCCSYCARGAAIGAASDSVSLIDSPHLGQISAGSLFVSMCEDPLHQSNFARPGTVAQRTGYADGEVLMRTEEIAAAIDKQIAELQQARNLIAGSAAAEEPANRPGRPKGTGKKTSAKKSATAPKRVMSAEGKARIAAAQKARWAAGKKAAKSAAKKMTPKPRAATKAPPAAQ